MKKSKFVPYIIFGIPALIGVYFVYKAIRYKNKPQSDEPIKDDVNENPNNSPSPTPMKEFPLRRGSKGSLVSLVQNKLGGIVVDGDFGKKTYDRVVAFQKEKGLFVDGIFGKNSWKALFGAEYPSVGSGGGSGTPLVYQPQQQQTGSVFGNNPFN
jgi:peptidoglycan hydrolase-like protein with peptidoglycan-binding domain